MGQPMGLPLCRVPDTGRPAWWTVGAVWPGLVVASRCHIRHYRHGPGSGTWHRPCSGRGPVALTGSTGDIMVRLSIALMLILVAPLGAQARDTGQAVLPPGESPPPGMCRIWIDGVPAGRQPAPTDCATAIRRRPPNARVIFGQELRGSRATDRGRQGLVPIPVPNLDNDQVKQAEPPQRAVAPDRAPEVTPEQIPGAKPRGTKPPVVKPPERRDPVVPHHEPRTIPQRPPASTPNPPPQKPRIPHRGM